MEREAWGEGCSVCASLYLWAISWAITSARDLSPANNVGVAKVRQGFSMPPYGKDGGRQSTS